MTAEDEHNINFIGPHEGRELALMISGEKPLSMFVEWEPLDCKVFAEDEFDVFVVEGRFSKHIRMESVPSPDGRDLKIRRVLYSQSSEVWRIPALLMVQDIYRSLAPGFRPDLERFMGLLLGYNRDDIEKFITRELSKGRK